MVTIEQLRAASREDLADYVSDLHTILYDSDPRSLH
jgi:hypothetical protein